MIGSVGGVVATFTDGEACLECWKGGAADDSGTMGGGERSTMNVNSDDGGFSSKSNLKLPYNGGAGNVRGCGEDGDGGYWSCRDSNLRAGLDPSEFGP